MFCCYCWLDLCAKNHIILFLPLLQGLGNGCTGELVQPNSKYFIWLVLVTVIQEQELYKPNSRTDCESLFHLYITSIFTLLQNSMWTSWLHHWQPLYPCHSFTNKKQNGHCNALEQLGSSFSVRKITSTTSISSIWGANWHTSRYLWLYWCCMTQSAAICTIGDAETPDIDAKSWRRDSTFFCSASNDFVSTHLY